MTDVSPPPQLPTIDGREARRGKDARRGKVTRHAASKDVSEAIKLLQGGPLTTGQLRKLTKYPQSANKLAAELQRCDKVSQDGVGGNWTLQNGRSQW